MNKVMTIAGKSVRRGEKETIQLHIANLPSGTPIHLSLHVYRAKKPGPVMLVTGGVHGDEVNGIEIVRRSIVDGFYENLLCGTAIVIPIVNVYGFINYSRDLPDGKDVNRSFPGHSRGSLASRVARAITKEILPHCDFGIDFHTGGAARYNFPQIRFRP